MAYSPEIQSLLNGAVVALRKGSYLRAMDSLSELEHYAIMHHTEFPTEARDLSRRASRMAARKELPRAIRRAQRLMKKGEYGHAESTLQVVETYAQEGGIELPAEFVEISRQVYQSGLQEHLQFAEKRLEAADYFYVKIALKNMETGAAKLGIEVPETVQGLRKKFEELTPQ